MHSNRLMRMHRLKTVAEANGGDPRQAQAADELSAR